VDWARANGPRGQVLPFALSDKSNGFLVFTSYIQARYEATGPLGLPPEQFAKLASVATGRRAERS